MNGTVYLIHLDTPMAHSQHYIGCSRFLKKRIEHHRSGSGARFLLEAVRRGISFDVVRKWTNADRTFERKLKNRKNARKLCPVCKQKECEK
jgi:predicted GIY-YIG superfamily endonuclease